MHFEVDVIVQHPLDDQARRFLTSVQKSANQVLRFQGDHERIAITVEAHAYDEAGALKAAIQEVGHIYPTLEARIANEPRPTS